MNAATITALCTGIAGVLTAVTALLRQLQHERNAQAHDGTPTPSSPPQVVK